MKIVTLVCRILLGLLFFVFGLNNLLHFIPMPPPSGDALTWIGILARHGWMNIVGIIMAIAGLLLLVNRFVPLALTLLAPIILNILLYHALLWPHGAAAGIVACLLEVVLIVAYLPSFLPLLAMSPERKTQTL